MEGVILFLCELIFCCNSEKCTFLDHMVYIGQVLSVTACIQHINFNELSSSLCRYSAFVISILHKSILSTCQIHLPLFFRFCSQGRLKTSVGIGRRMQAPHAPRIRRWGMGWESLAIFFSKIFGARNEYFGAPSDLSDEHTKYFNKKNFSNKIFWLILVDLSELQAWGCKLQPVPPFNTPSVVTDH